MTNRHTRILTIQDCIEMVNLEMLAIAEHKGLMLAKRQRIKSLMDVKARLVRLLRTADEEILSTGFLNKPCNSE